ncbi:hypothetical protein OFM97_29950, partial [Escherichia coli]|nr:hypothetical protein [Escherichia coli]
MMRFEVSVQLPLLDVDLRDQARARVSEVALASETEMKLSMRGPKSGRTYMRRGRTRSGRPNIHRASAPGEPPAVDSGNLW